MAQGVEASMKAYYLRLTFAKANRVTGGGPTLKELWKKFNILDASIITGEAWNAKESNIREVWKQLSPEFTKDFEGFEDLMENVTVKMASQLQLEVSAAEDVIKLLQFHSQETANHDWLNLETMWGEGQHFKHPSFHI